MNPFNKYSIRSEVMKLINKEIEAEQKSLDAEIKKIDEKAELDKKNAVKVRINKFFVNVTTPAK